MIEAKNDETKIKEAEELYNQQQQLINEKFQQDVTNTIKIKSNELAHKSTETILKKAEERKRDSVEDDVRARLRGFARTIPSF